MIQVSNLTRYYGALPALRDVSFEVNRGEIVGLLGLNGAGKSTALKILAGVLAPSEGSVTMDGQNVTNNADNLKSKIGFLPEEPPLYRDMTVSSFLTYVGRLKGMDRQSVLARLPEVIATTGLQARENQIIGTLSHGYKKRVGIAMAVIHSPSLVILDEPISGLDPMQIKEMRTVIRKLGKDRAVLISSHILSEMSKTCDRLVVLHQGKMVAQGTQEELTRHLAGTRVQITVRGDTEVVSEWLSNHPNVQGHATKATRDKLAVSTIQMDGDKREALVSDLIKANFGIRLVEEPEYDLEEVFLRFTSTRKAQSVTTSDEHTDEVAPTEEINQ
jgi:ABC-2 type transport system ATP-binding protein